jgi:hypothetical protein
MTPIFLLSYPEPRKVPTNPRWCPYTKGSPQEGQPPRSSNSVKSHRPSPRASGAPLLAPLGRFLSSPLSSFRPKCRRPRSLRYTVVVVTQMRLSRSRKTLARDENGWKRSVNTKTITVFIFFIRNKIENGTSGNGNNIGISKTSETKVWCGKYTGNGRNLKYNR